MFVQQVLDALGLPAEEMIAILWPKDRAARLQEKADRLNESLQRRLAALVRRRRVIESIRQHVAEKERCLARHRASRGEQLSICGDAVAVPVCAVELECVQQRLGRERARLEKHEVAYQAQLARLLHGKRKLARLRERLLAARRARP